MTDDSLALAQAQQGVTAEERALVDGMAGDHEMRVSVGEKAAGLEAGVGQRLLKKVSVRRYLAAVLADRRERHAEIRDGVIHALWALATYDIADAVDDSEIDLDRMPENLDEAMQALAGGRLKPPHKLPPALRAAVKGVKMGRNGWEYVFVDRAQILLALMKHFGEAAANKGPDNAAVVETRKIVYYDDGTVVASVEKKD